MAHDTHAAPAGDDHAAHPHPALPPIHDEAPDTPMWLPVTGLALLALLVLFSLFRAASSNAGTAASDEVAVDGAEAAPAEAAPAGAAPAAVVPAPAH